MARGGPRQGQPDKAYTNRTDLAADRTTQPVRTAPGQTYGTQAAQAEAQRVNPLPQQQPIQLPGFSRPTERPAEPVTAGAPIGAGPGPEAVPQVGPGEWPDLERVRAMLPALEYMANRPGVSQATRNYVRQIRGSLPIGDM